MGQQQAGKSVEPEFDCWKWVLLEHNQVLTAGPNGPRYSPIGPSCPKIV